MIHTINLFIDERSNKGGVDFYVVVVLLSFKGGM